MKDPTQNENDQFEIVSLDFMNGMIVADTLINAVQIPLIIDASQGDFDKFCPNVEGELTDGDYYTARFDDHGNLHWLVKNEGHISYHTVNCNEIIRDLAYDKYST